MNKCSAKNQARKPCQAPALPNSAYCVFHDPNHREICADARRRGGFNRRTNGLIGDFPDANLRTAGGLLDFMEVVIRDTWALGNSVQRNRTLAALIHVQKELAGLDEIHARLEAIEKVLNNRTET